MTFATYASSYTPWTPSTLLPEPNDSITYDWYDAVGQFAQRLTKIATAIATVGYGSSYVFDYSSMGCDYFPPIIKVYFGTNGYWREFDFFNTLGANKLGRTGNAGSLNRDYIQLREVGLGSCKFYSNVNQTIGWKFIAYM